jgi:hypothetical protein
MQSNVSVIPLVSAFMNIISAILKLGLYRNGEVGMAKFLGIFLQLGSANAPNLMPYQQIRLNLSTS